MRKHIENISIEKLVVGGQALGRHDNKVIFTWNALPGETVDIEITKNKKDYSEGIATGIKNESPDRIIPKEDHHMSCSPWQILDFSQEAAYKKNIALEVYKKNGSIELSDIQIQSPDQEFGYRNKMEYSFTLDDKDIVQLAFFQRGGRKKIPIEPCILASDSINNAATGILSWIRDVKIPIRSLKALIIRSNSNGEAIAGLFLKDRLSIKPPSEIFGLNGLAIYYSTHRSPASIITGGLFSKGDLTLTESIHNTELTYGLNSFFQVNIPMFESAITKIKKHIPEGSSIIDFYSGVGSISIPLNDHVASATLVDNNQEAIEYAQKNIEANELDNYEAISSPAEKITELITAEKVLILDPPRAGLHKDVTKKILEVTPETIVYMSCNPATHARDLGLLTEKYDIVSIELFNFFPRTPHIESLALLKKK